MKRVLRRPIGVTKVVKQGFSWTVFFFGALVPLFRGDIKWFLIMLFSGMFTFGLSNIVFIFIYNQKYIEDLLEKGYSFVD